MTITTRTTNMRSRKLTTPVRIMSGEYGEVSVLFTVFRLQALEQNQIDSQYAHSSEGRGHRFESCRVRQQLYEFDVFFVLPSI